MEILKRYFDDINNIKNNTITILNQFICNVISKFISKIVIKIGQNIGFSIWFVKDNI